MTTDTPDLATMRDSADLALIDAHPVRELDTLALALRGHLAVLIPAVERMVGGRPKSVAECCAVVCVGEARRKLDVKPRPGLDAGAAYARRLARVLSALCDHYERLGGQG